MTVLQDDRSALALQALAEVTDPASVGELIEVTEPEPGVRDLVFACRLPGYVAWRWTVSTGQVGDAAPTVLEVELLPGEGSLVAPPWVPWAERLAEYRRTHPGEADDAGEDLDDDEDEDLDEVDADSLEIDGVEFEDASDDEESGDEDASDDASDEDESDDDASDDDASDDTDGSSDDEPSDEPADADGAPDTTDPTTPSGRG